MRDNISNCCHWDSFPKKERYVSCLLGFEFEQETVARDPNPNQLTMGV